VDKISLFDVGPADEGANDAAANGEW
jgi:hypothetical protein